MDKSDERLIYLHPPCYYCKHVTKIGTLQSLQGWTCTAYPEGISPAILHRLVSHTELFPGQEGEAVFESKVFPFHDGLCKITVDACWYPISDMTPQDVTEPTF